MRPRAGSIGLALAAIVAFGACTAGGGGGASGVPSSVGSAEPPSAAASATPSVAASASGAASAATGSSSGPCALVTVEEVAQIVGVDATAVEADERSCIYETTSGAIVALVQRTTEGAAKLYADFKGNPASTPVNDLGDEAIWLPAMEAVQLHVLQGDDMLSIGVGTLSGVPVDELTGTSPEVLVDMATQLGKIAVGRL